MKTFDQSGSETSHPLLELEAVTKVYPNGTVALREVDLRVSRGSVHGLVGGNGAGKSTLVKVLAGAVRASSGTLRWCGVDQFWQRPRDAHRAGVATIHQNVPLVPTLSVIENVFLGSEGRWRRSRHELQAYEELVERVGYKVDPNAKVGDLPIGIRQMVAILQALAEGADLIIMDEPTASLAESERAAVFRTVRRLREAGTTFIYVTHFLDEILDLTDRLTVLRDGMVAVDGPTSEFDETSIVRAILGDEVASELGEGRARVAHELGRELLAVRNLSSPSGIRGVSFSVAAGEIVGLAGLLGSGRSEILHGIYGSDRFASGSVTVAGEALKPGVAAAVAAGIGLVPEDRNRQGLMLEKSLTANVALPELSALSHFKFLADAGRERERTKRGIDLLRIVAKGPDATVGSLSGGNAQKVLFARWLLANVRVLLLDEPTAGVDVGAKATIHEQIRRFAQAGGAVVIVDSEFEELLGLAHRVLVIREGKVVAEHLSAETNEHVLLRQASGLEVC